MRKKNFYSIKFSVYFPKALPLPLPFPSTEQEKQTMNKKRAKEGVPSTKFSLKQENYHKGAF